MDNLKLKEKIFVENYSEFCDSFSENCIIEGEAKVIEIENGLLLPCKKIKNTFQKAEGGVTDQFGEFISGHKTYFNEYQKVVGWDCIRSYKFNEDIIKRDEIVIYGGCLIMQFGHFLIEGLSRIWYLIQNPNIDHKLVFLTFPGYDTFKFDEIMISIGLTKDRYEVINKITQFKKIIVPEQTAYIGGRFKKENRYVYDAIISKITPSSIKKIYLSKSKYHSNNSSREIYFEEFYEKRGFEIIYPETLPFIQQVAILNGADEVVCTAGTILQLTYFCKDYAKITVLTRKKYVLGEFPRAFSIKMRNLDDYYVDVTYNFLPIGYNRSIFFIGPTKHWIEYLDSENIHYNTDEVSFDVHVKPHIYDYLIDWAKHYNKNNPYAYSIIKNQTLPDLINLIHQTFLGETIDTKKFPERDDVVRMQNQIKELNATIDRQKKQIEEQKQSADLKENITQVVTQMGLLDAYQKLARQTEDKFNIVRNVVTKMEDDLKSTNKDLEEKCEILKDQVKKQNKKIKLLEEKFIQLEENSKPKGLFGKK